ncbi:sigma-70 family RNA polymerase sigma factor [Streptomyces sp. PCS3-D2]|uniref:sigma-70 family RNA polymerase sigma factor n=1 Tax=Streptomyces sp. PCS3-D2 TaxID=1460244 RepID=UPI000690CDC7|nr:sigma-70 family RNA polymerase sigma factor [Streptomyces sp. PCS3-D2]WKV72893.1 sigma-70 family RNA polymerase sigma factor [Streptomyces sp. PCS3-D2]
MTEHAGLSVAERSDEELAESIRGGAEERAMAELYARHRSAVLAYARTCCRDAHTAEDLAAEAFAKTLEAVRSGGGPTGPWRPYLLTVVRRTAMAWADTARRAELTEDVERWEQAVPHTGGGEEFALRGEEDDLVLRGFRALPERWQAVLWHTLVEEESAQRVGAMMGLSASGVWSLAERAREGLREAYLSEHAHGPRASHECRRHSPLMAAAVRRGRRTAGRRLDRHLGDCGSCRKAFHDLTEINSRLRVVLPGAVLLWGAEKYLSSYAVTAAAAGGAGAAAGGSGAAAGGSGAAAGLPAAKLVAVSLAAATAIGALAYVVVPEGADTRRAAPPVVRETSGPSLPTGTAGPAATPEATRSPAPGSSPSAVPSIPLARTAQAAAAVVAPAGPGERTRLRIDATGMCMEIPGGSGQAGVQPREAACTGAAYQEWDVIAQEKRRRVMLRNGGTGMCLTHTGSTASGAPVRQALCDATNPLQVWSINRHDDKGTAGIFTSDNMYLGLKQWAPAARGEAHDPLIATSPHYYLSPSLHFRTDW